MSAALLNGFWWSQQTWLHPNLNLSLISKIIIPAWVCWGCSSNSQLLDLLKIPKWKRKWTVLPLFLLGSDTIHCRCSIPHWIRATAGWVRAGVRSSTLPSTGTASSTQSHNERHSQLCRPARWHFHQSKPGWRQILNYLTPEISNSVEPHPSPSKQTIVDTHRLCWNGERDCFWRDKILDYSCVAWDNTSWCWLLQKYLQSCEKTRTALLLCSKLQSSCDLVPNVWLTQQTQDTAKAWISPPFLSRFSRYQIN